MLKWVREGCNARRSNHHNIWADARVQEQTYRYYKPETRGLDFDGLMTDIKEAPKGSFFLLHACAHNPTGVDPTKPQVRSPRRSHFNLTSLTHRITRWLRTESAWLVAAAVGGDLQGDEGEGALPLL